MDRLTLMQARERTDELLSELGEDDQRAARSILRMGTWYNRVDLAQEAVEIASRCGEVSGPAGGVVRRAAALLAAVQRSFDYDAGRDAVIERVRAAAEGPTVDARTANRLLDAAEGR